jgi:hypothetical protein
MEYARSGKGWIERCAGRYFRRSDKQKIAEAFHVAQLGGRG